MLSARAAERVMRGPGGCFASLAGLVAALLVAAVGLLLLIASTGIVRVPLLSGLVFGEPPDPSRAYAVGQANLAARNERSEAIGAELLEVWDGRAGPGKDTFVLSQQDAADALSVLALNGGADAVARSIGVSFEPDVVHARVLFDSRSLMESRVPPRVTAVLSPGTTSVEVDVRVRYARSWRAYRCVRASWSCGSFRPGNRLHAGRSPPHDRRGALQ